MGYGVAKASLLERAAHVIIGSSSKEKVEDALKRLEADVANASVEGKISGDVVDGKDSASVKAFFEKIGEIDHLVWTSGDGLNFVGQDIEEHKGELPAHLACGVCLDVCMQGVLMCDSGARPLRPRQRRFEKGVL